MTLLSRLLLLFPTIILLLSIAAFLYLCYSPGLISLLILILILYGLPVFSYRLHQWFYPILEGITYLGEKIYSPWWGSHQIQIIYIAFPLLETSLRLIPGLFSVWLRLWGAKIGKQVYWTPGLEIADRGLLEIGDRVVFGHRVGLYSHVIKPRKQDLMLYVKKIKIGNDVFLGAAVRIGPGVIIQDGVFVPVKTDLFPNMELK